MQAQEGVTVNISYVAPLVCKSVCFSPDIIDVSRYSPLFNSHLQACVDRQILPVASDTVDFMLSKNLAVDHRVLQILLHKLGKQNLWLRAREVFRRECNFPFCVFFILFWQGGLVHPCKYGSLTQFKKIVSLDLIVPLSAGPIVCLKHQIINQKNYFIL